MEREQSRGAEAQVPSSNASREPVGALRQPERPEQPRDHVREAVAVNRLVGVRIESRPAALEVLQVLVRDQLGPSVAFTRMDLLVLGGGRGEGFEHDGDLTAARQTQTRGSAAARL
jgi:hypothetical protein